MLLQFRISRQRKSLEKLWFYHIIELTIQGHYKKSWCEEVHKGQSQQKKGHPMPTI